MRAALFMLTIGLMILTGCGAPSGVRPYAASKSAFSEEPSLLPHTVPEDEIYRVFQQGATGFVSINSVRKAAERRACEFCERQGKGVLILGEKSSQGPYILGNFPRTEVVFACVDLPKKPSPNNAGETRYQRLGELKELLDDGAITRDEFDREKARILDEQ